MNTRANKELIRSTAIVIGAWLIVIAAGVNIASERDNSDGLVSGTQRCERQRHPDDASERHEHVGR